MSGFLGNDVRSGIGDFNSLMGLVGPAAGLIGGLSGILGGNAAKKNAEARRQWMLDDLQRELDQEYNGLQERNRRGLYAAAGQGGDAVSALGRRFGDSLAGAGIYNSTATAGALTQAEADKNASLVDLANRNSYDEKSLLGQNQRYLTGLKLGVANQDVGQANSNLDASRNGLSSFLGSLTQYNLARSGAPPGNSIIGAQNGARNSVLASPGEGMTPPDMNAITARRLFLNNPGYAGSFIKGW